MAEHQWHARRAVGFFMSFGLPVLLTCLSVTAVAQSGLPDFVSLVEANSPSIVNITTRQEVPVRNSSRQRDIEELLRQLQPDGESAEIPELPPTRPRGGVGSGFIISDDGYIITNHHVVANADRITVTLTDRREYIADIIGSDELSDVALIRIDATGLNPVIFGDSEQVRVGEWVLAIGSPFGLEFSAAAGIVSAKSRNVPSRGPANYVSFIQTDVAINQGNSGGPLFNLAGEVIGINSQILSSTGGSNGISFAIPSNMALNVIEQLRENGTVARGLLGVLIKDVDHALSQAFGLNRPRGAFVDEVQPGSPAERAGVRTNDIVLAFNGTQIEQSAQLPFYVGQVRPGTQAVLTVMREGRQLDLDVVVGALPSNDVAASGASRPSSRGNSLALTVTPLPSGAADDVPELADGGVIIDELRDGPARAAGLASGDVIVTLNHQPIGSVADFNRVVESLPEEGFVAVRVVRNGRGTTLVVELR
ncbi:Do family serine endopeptidase [Pseudohongiella spirulinae]|uniref:Probable periplasmic serine endoprotease DegP-like n=1 Tax=Pseudohongiella spirulinae TaxID=1249552 RepID=A0A0S2KD71_9GAMM|nr:Do family serine endopeptidase [Pseudohongiella spirulinae]ALO46251.1 Putative periplasmic serine endoprotease DegP-like [Pseudohongiella spirulinae]